MSEENTLITEEVPVVDNQPEQPAETNVSENTDAGVDGAKEVDEKQPEESKPESEVPEKYEFKAPDGVEYDADTLKVYEEAAREAGLSQEKADIILGKLAPHMAEKQAEVVAKVRNDWAEQSRSDKEFGGEKLQENLAVAQKAMKQFGSPELTELLNKSGLGNHPEIIRAFYRAGKAISEDGFVAGGKASVQNGDARALFPNSNMNP